MSIRAFPRPKITDGGVDSITRALAELVARLPNPLPARAGNIRLPYQSPRFNALEVRILADGDPDLLVAFRLWHGEEVGRATLGIVVQRGEGMQSAIQSLAHLAEVAPLTATVHSIGGWNLQRIAYLAGADNMTKGSRP